MICILTNIAEYLYSIFAAENSAVIFNLMVEFHKL